MIVLTISKCPAGLKGDISKWLFEISSGVFVGKLNARVRDLLWKRVCEHCLSGEATMVFTARNEQGYSFYVHNTEWLPTDYDGIVLMKKPLPPSYLNKPETQHKKKSKLFAKSDISEIILRDSFKAPMDFVAIDIETTGLNSSKDRIIEIGAVHFINGEPKEEYHELISIDKPIPKEIQTLTGITDEMLGQNGVSLKDAITKLKSFVGTEILVGHYIRFDMKFLEKAFTDLKITVEGHQVIDTVTVSKGIYVNKIDSFRLENLIRIFKIADKQNHRALPDSYLAAKLYLKLIEKLKE